MQYDTRESSNVLISIGSAQWRELTPHEPTLRKDLLPIYSFFNFSHRDVLRFGLKIKALAVALVFLGAVA
jgi:hypothetical protein